VSALRPRLLVPGLFAAAGFVVLIALGVWQLERRAWKETLIDAVSERIAAPPSELPGPLLWAVTQADRHEFRRVSFPAEFLHEQEALVYTVGSSLRGDVSGPGYWVFTPARLAGGSLLMINRGFVPEDRRDPATRAEGQPAGVVEIAGALRWPEPRGWFTPKDDPQRNVWFARDHRAIAEWKNLGDVAPFYVEQETPVPPGGFPKPGPLAVKLRNDHLQYALTWFGLAAVLLAVFAVWAINPAGRKPPSGR
jgi:surfeit locus 1 family protein